MRNLIFEETCISPPVFVVGKGVNHVHNVEDCNGSRVATSITDGQYAKTAYWADGCVNMEVWKGMPLVGSSKKHRSEIVIIHGVEDKRWTYESWYALSMFFPSDGTEKDSVRDCINQWYQTGGKESSLRMQDGKAFYEQEATGVRCDLFGSGGSQSVSRMNDIVRDKWVHFVFHFIHSTGGDGLIEIWRDGEKIHTVPGATMSGTVKPKWKVGIYKSSMESSNFQYRKMKFKNVFYGDQTSTLEDMLLGDIIDPPADKPPIVNAGVDQTLFLPVDSIMLNGSGSDISGITKYEWGQISGANANITYPDSAITPVTGIAEGSYSFQLTVTNGKGITASDTVDVVVKQVGEKVNMKFAVIGDFGKDSSKEKAVSDLLKAYNPEFIITTGDNNYSDGEASTIVANIGKHYGGFIHNPGGVPRVEAGTVNRFFPCPGNHDWHAPNLTPYLQYFTGLPKNADGHSRYYDFVKGNVHFFMVDSGDEEPDGRTKTSKQAVWLKDRLASSTAKFKIVAFHHGAYSSSSKHGNERDLQWPFKEWGATINLSGHDHTYERLVVNGHLYIVNGLGGNDVYPFGSPITGSQFRYNGTQGFQLVTVTDDSMTLKFINVNNVVIDTVTIGTIAENKPPIAQAGADKVITLPVDTITLNGSASTDDNVIVLYKWEKISGGSAVISAPNSISTNVSSLSQGTYIFRLTVTDDKGLSSTDDIAITVNERVNVRPIANAGSDKVEQWGNIVQLNGTAIDGDGVIEKIVWEKVYGGNYLIDNPNMLKPVLSDLEIGEYIFRLTVIDNDGEEGQDEISIRIVDVNNLPSADAGPDVEIGIIGNSVVLNGTKSRDSDGVIVSYKWEKINGPNCVIQSPNEAITNVINLIQGVYTFELTTKDEDGGVSTDQVVITAKNVVSVIEGKQLPTSYKVTGNISITPKFGTEDGGVVDITF